MNFIAPKNFKSGRLISNKYTWFDLVLLIVGIIGSVILEALFVILFLQENILVNILISTILALPAIIVLA